MSDHTIRYEKGDKKIKCKVTLSKNVTKTYDIPIDSPINGKESIRKDITSKNGIVEGSILRTNQDNENVLEGKIFSSEFTGEYLTTSIAKIKEGGDMGNPNKLTTTTILGVF